MKNRQRQTNRHRDRQTCMYTLYPNKFMKYTIVRYENVWARKAPVSERSWVRKDLGPNRLFLLGPKGLGSERSWVRNVRHSERRPNRWMDGRTDGRLASWNCQTNTCNSSMSRQVGVIKSNVKVQSSHLTKKCLDVDISNMNDKVLIVRE